MLHLQPFLWHKPIHVCRTANRIHDWASNSIATIIGHPCAARADEKALIMATPGFSSEMTQSSHDSVLDLADVLAYAVVEDRHVDLRT